MNRRDVFLLILFLLLGAGITIVQSIREGHLPFDIQVEGADFLKGRAHSFGETQEIDLPAGGRVEIVSERGSVEVEVWDQPRVRVQARKEVRAESETEARKLAQGLRLDLASVPGGIRARMAADSPGTLPKDVVVDYTVTVPPGARLEASTRHGDLIVHGLRGDVRLRNDHGDVDVADLGAGCQVANENGAVTASRVRGNLKISTSHEDVSVSDAGASVELALQHSSATVEGADGSVVVANRHGDVRVERVGKDVRVEAPHCSIHVERVEGTVSIVAEADPVQVAEVKGPVTVRADATSVEVTDVAGNIQVMGSHTDVRVIRPAGDVEIHTTHQDIELEPPPGAGFRLEATSEQGEVDSDIPGLHLPAERPARFAGSLGNGRARYRLFTSYSTIRIRNATAAAAGR